MSQSAKAGNASEMVLVEVRTRLRSSHVNRFLRKASRPSDSCGVSGTARLRGGGLLPEHQSREAAGGTPGPFVIRATGNSARILDARDFEPRVLA